MARLVSRTTAKRAAAALQTPPQGSLAREGAQHSSPDADPSPASKRTRRSSPTPSSSAAAAAGPPGRPMAVTRARVGVDGAGDADALPWPVPAAALEQGRRFIARMAAVAKACHTLSPAGPSPILLVPDKDADGLSAGVILHRTLLRVYGVPGAAIRVHHVGRGASPGSAAEREAMSASQARWIIVLDQGSRHGPGLTNAAERGWAWDDSEAPEEQARREMSEAQPRVRSLVIDHHHLAPGEEGPKGALMLNACAYEPVATSALLTWCICRPLWTAVDSDATSEHSRGRGSPMTHTESEAQAALDYLALIGTCGDLGVQVKWAPPWPDLEPELKRCTRKRIGEIVSAVNAPRRTPRFDVSSAYLSLLSSTTAADVLDTQVNKHAAGLMEARSEVAAQVARFSHTAPKFSKDGRVALLTISTPYQVHPSIATRWAGTLRGAKKLEGVFCANVGYAPDPTDSQGGQRAVHFSGRVAKAARDRGEEPSLIELLHSYASMDGTFLQELCVEEGVDTSSALSFARGHRQASGGIMPASFWERFTLLMGIGERPSPDPSGSSPRKRGGAAPTQNNKLTSYFKPA